MHSGLAAVWNDYLDLRYRLFRSRAHSGVIARILLALVMAVLVGLAAQVRIPLPWSPVPITGQTFAVLLAGVLLGRRWGGVSMAFYAGLGVMGVPWFTGWGSGMSHLAGPTGGYILGFIFAALFIGYMTDRYVRSRSFLSMLGIMLVANFLFIYGMGLIQLGFWMNMVKGSAVTFSGLLYMGLIPFLAGDMTKAVAAAAIARVITPKKAYSDEADNGKWSSWRLP
ncbi:MAG: biotin transporter BioY [Chloroflexota bacterium]